MLAEGICDFLQPILTNAGTVARIRPTIFIFNPLSDTLSYT